MWNLLKRDDEDCKKLRDALDEAAKHACAVSVQTLTGELTAEERKHIEMCSDCREAIRELVATKELFQGAASFAEEERPWFPARVMAAIASRERELAERVSAWAEFPRFASRLTWVAAIVLLASTTWFYRSVVRAPSYTSPGSQEFLFEAPQQTSPDDILISMAGDNP
jgi:predicted anti-sigma-YlaC factor YlaD